MNNKWKLLCDLSVLFGSFGGALLLAMHGDYSKWAYLLYLSGNLGTIYLLRNSTASGSLAMVNYGYLLINCFGLLNWFGVFK